MTFQEGPADTLSYMLLGFGVIFGVMALYIGGLWIRLRNGRRDVSMLESMDIESRR